MADFAGNGLTSPALDFGGSCPISYGCAFPGINPAAPAVPLLEPIGRSVYNGLDVKLTENVDTHFYGITHVNPSGVLQPLPFSKSRWFQSDEPRRERSGLRSCRH